MKLRTLKRRTAARVLSWAQWLACLTGSRDEWQDDWDDDGQERNAICEHCSGTGGDPWNDGITPCEHCDGEGYEWWK